jgi:hypothetical protein
LKARGANFFFFSHCCYYYYDYYYYHHIYIYIVFSFLTFCLS